MKITFLSFLFISFFSSHLLAQNINSIFTQNLTDFGISPISEQAFCYKDLKGTIQGYNPTKAQRIASVTKVFTTLLAVSSSSLNKTYKTIFHIAGGSLHIQGGNDPYFEEEKMFFLISALNKLGIKKLSQVTFDENFYFADDALGTYEVLTAERVRKKINEYFNTSTYSATIQSNLRVTRAFIKDERLDFELPIFSMSTKSVKVKNINPLVNKNPTTFTHESRPLHAILKSMNAMSKNWIAEHLFDEFGGAASLQTLFTKFGINNSSYKILNGSGLPIESKNTRFDNWASCSTVLSVLEILKNKIEAQKFQLEDVVAHGTDHGTLEKRFIDNIELKEGVLAKTGTLKHTSTLAGFITYGTFMPFAILNQTTNSAGSRHMQDAFLTDFTRETERPISINYEARNIFPLDSADFFSEI